MPKPVKRKGSESWYLHLRVPADVADVYGRAHVWKSLRTTDEGEAKRRLHVIAAQVLAEFQAIRAQRIVGSSPDAEYQRTVAEDQRNRLAAWARAEGNEALFWRGRVIPLPDDPKTDALLAEADNLPAAFDHARRQNLKREMRALAAKISRGDVGEFLETAGGDAEAALRLANARKRALSDIIDGADVSAVKDVRGDKLSVAAAAWTREQGWTPKREAAVEAILRGFIETCGDKAIGAYTKADARNYKVVLQKVPANAHKRRQFARMTLPQIAAASTLPAMSDANVNKHLAALKQLWKWLLEHYDEAAPVFIVSRLRAKQAPSEERDAFSAGDLKKIFAAPLYTGCESEIHWQTPGGVIPRESAKFWVPLISLFTGARLNEVCQLWADDIEKGAGGYFFRIHADDERGQRVKNAKSTRLVPVHPELVAIGLVDFASRRKGPLFPDLSPGADGYYSTTFSKHFRRHLESVGVKRSKISAHSFRHTFKTAGASCSVPELQLDAMMGHTSGGMSGRYLKTLESRALARAMSKVKFDLDLAALHLASSERSKARARARP